MVACPAIRKFPFPARPRSPSIKACPKAEPKRWPSPRENAVQRSRSPIEGITPQTSASTRAAPSKIKLAAIGKNDFGEIESIPLPCREIAADFAPQAERNGSRGKPREFSVICYRFAESGPAEKLKYDNRLRT